MKKEKKKHDEANPADYQEITRQVCILDEIGHNVEAMEGSLIKYDIGQYFYDIDFERPGKNLKSYKFNNIAYLDIFQDRKEYRTMVKKLLSVLKETDKELFIYFVYKLINIIETKEKDIRDLLYVLYEKDCHLKGIPPFMYQENKGSEPEFAEIENPAMDRLEIEMKKRIPKGQPPTNADSQYKAVAYISKTIDVRCYKGSETMACEFIGIRPSNLSKWKKGTDNKGRKNLDKYLQWKDETPKNVIDQLEPLITKFNNSRMPPPLQEIQKIIPHEFTLSKVRKSVTLLKV